MVNSSATFLARSRSTCRSRPHRPLAARRALRRAARPLQEHFSEFALIRAARPRRDRVADRARRRAGLPEVAPVRRAAAAAKLARSPPAFGEADAERVKAIEATTNHDVKAIEYWLRERVAGDAGARRAPREFIHFACTSEDINNLAYALMVRGARDEVLLPAIDAIVGAARASSRTSTPTRDARAHARPAGDADHARQGDGQRRPSAAARARAARRGRAARAR